MKSQFIIHTIIYVLLYISACSQPTKEPNSIVNKPHTDHLEFSGLYVSAIINCGSNSNGKEIQRSIWNGKSEIKVKF